MGDLSPAYAPFVGTLPPVMRGTGGFSKYHAYIFADGVVTNLNSLIPSGSGLHLAFAYAINNDGQSAGVAADAQYRNHAFLLTPVGRRFGDRQHRGRFGHRGRYRHQDHHAHADAVGHIRESGYGVLQHR
jgi:hypothetical protein